MEIKEIKSVRIVPFTLMSACISAVLGLLYAIILLIIIGIVGAFLPGFSQVLGVIVTLSLTLIITLPLGLFLLNILSSFLIAWIYNLLVPRVGGIKLGMDGKEVKSLPVIPFSLITSILYATLSLILMLIMAPLFALILQTVGFVSAATAGSPELSVLGTLGVIGAIILIIAVPVVVFIATFISSALTALFYNLLAPKIGGVKFKFKSAAHGFCEIKKIPPIPLALISAVVLTIVNFIFGIPGFILNIVSGEAFAGFGFLVGNTIGNFIGFLIVYAIMALLYNFLRSKIGGVEIELK